MVPVHQATIRGVPIARGAESALGVTGLESSPQAGRKKEMAITFVIGTSGLNTRIDEFYASEGEWHLADLPSNVNWESVTVPTQANVSEWLDAKNLWLEASWTPNQSHEDRIENARIMREAEARMEAASSL